MSSTYRHQLFERAQQSLVGGVNSPVRAFKSVGGTPLFIQRAEGAYLYDEEGKQYIDLINSWGPMILGHAHPQVSEAIAKQLQKSTSYGAPTVLEIEVAELMKAMVPNIEMVRMVNSGTEACMSAIRLARGYTGKNKFIKFEGCYHGHADCFLVQAGSGVATFGIQQVPGVTQGAAQDTINCVYNDLNDVEQKIQENTGQIAAIILEPVAGNMGCVPPSSGFVEGLRKICDREEILLIFDEVMTGFRLAAGGAQTYLNVQADLMTYGKVIGAGMPVGAVAGRKEIMENLAPVGKVYQAGTLSGNPLAMSAGFALLNILHENRNVYTELEEKGKYLEQGLKTALQKHNVDAVINRSGSMLSLHFGKEEVVDFKSSTQSANNGIFNQYFHYLLEQGIYLPPSAYETWFLSHALTKEDLDKIIYCSEEFFRGR